MKAGDLLCITGRSGIGPALGFRHLLGSPVTLLPESAYRPEARIRAGRALGALATAAMDTSDGIASTLSTLARLNKCHFALSWNPAALSPLALEYCEADGIPMSSLWFGEHGDFQLIASLPERTLSQALSKIPDLTVIGKVIDGPGPHTLLTQGFAREIDLDLVVEAPKGSLREFRQAFDRMIADLVARGLP
jgi:thiamine monophosphate kinase